MNKTCVYSLTQLQQLWAAGKTHLEIAAALGCSEMYVATLRKRHNLPYRRRRYAKPVDVDPTPAEIEERKAALRAVHLQQRLTENAEASSSRGKRQRMENEMSARVFCWDGFQFRTV